MFVIDFDDTLFNTRGKDGFSLTRIKELGKIGINEDLYIETYYEARDHADGRCAYSDERHAGALSLRGFDEEEVLSVLRKVTKNVKHFLFPDAVDFLKALKKYNRPMILLSLGDPEYQYLKVSGCGIVEYFDRVFMVSKTKKDILSELFGKVRAGDVWFINDKVGETLELSRDFPRMKIVFKISEFIHIKEYKKTMLPYFKTLGEIKNYIADRIL